MEVALRDVALAMMKSDRGSYYIDLAKGCVLEESDFGDEDAALRLESREADWQRYVLIPNLRDSVERNLMQGFSEAQRSDVRARLLAELAGAGGAMRFLRQVKRLFLAQAWESYQERIYMDIARDFCEENEIPLRDE